MECLDLKFEFISDLALRTVVEDYYSQTQRAASVDSYLGVVVGCGSIAEGMLTWALLCSPEKALGSSKAPKDRQGTVVPIERWSLPWLIDVATDLQLLGNTARQASWALKDFRNFIHPYNLLRQSARPDQALAMSSLAALGEIRRSVESRIAS